MQIGVALLQELQRCFVARYLHPHCSTCSMLRDDGNPPFFARESEVETFCSHGQFLLWCKSTQSHVGAVMVTNFSESNVIPEYTGTRVA
jgi:hypothetical protein